MPKIGNKIMGEVNCGMDNPQVSIPIIEKVEKEEQPIDADFLLDMRTRYASSFTMHALNHIQDGKLLEKIVWLVKLLGLFTTAVYFSLGIFESYFRHDVHTTIKTSLETKLKFPKVYVCTNRNAQVNAGMTRWNDCSRKSSKSYDSRICSSLGRLYPAFISQKSIAEGEINCADDRKETICHRPSNLGQCITFNADGKSEQKLEDDYEDDLGGDLRPGISKTVGGRNVSYFPLELWISTSEWKWGQSVYKSIIDRPGKYSYKLSKTVHKRLPSPYTNCVKDGSPIDQSKNFFRGPYTFAKCVTTCRIKAELNVCGMIRNEFRIYMRNNTYKAQLKNITIWEQTYCWFRNGDIMFNQTNACMKECPEPCDEMKFEVSETYLVGEKYRQDTVGLVHWELQFRNFIVTEVGQEPNYELTSLISNFGGTLGLMCGMSAVSVLELLIWAVLSIAVLIFRSHNTRI